MMIRDMFADDINRKINGVIKVWMTRSFPNMLLRVPIVDRMQLHTISAKNAKVEHDIRMNFAPILTMHAFYT